ncbi:MAG: hypothetical protein IPI12_04780 [Ignavibacteriales bacterium]|nr:hypothetical protein [Ignavibacteriales bacterium]
MQQILWVLGFETTGTTVSDQESKCSGKFYTALIDVHQVSTPPTYELTDGDKVWIVNHYQNKPVMTVAGAGVDNEYIVASNTTNTLTLASPWLTTPIVDGNANMTWMAYEDPTESTQWLVSSAPLSENASLINTNTQTSVGTGGVVKVTITSTPSSENNLGVVQLGSSSGTPVSTGETFPAGITMRSNLTWNIQEWGTVIANLIFDYSGFEGISDPTSVVLLRRVRDSQTWTEVTPTSRDNAAMTFTLDGQTDFIAIFLFDRQRSAAEFTSQLLPRGKSWYPLLHRLYHRKFYGYLQQAKKYRTKKVIVSKVSGPPILNHTLIV